MPQSLPEWHLPVIKCYKNFIVTSFVIAFLMVTLHLQRRKRRLTRQSSSFLCSTPAFGPVFLYWLWFNQSTPLSYHVSRNCCIDQCWSNPELHMSNTLISSLGSIQMPSLDLLFFVLYGRFWLCRFLHCCQVNFRTLVAMTTAKYFLVLYLFAQFAAFLFFVCVCEVHGVIILPCRR